MPAIRYKGVEYGGPSVHIQSDTTATDLEDTQVPNGQTIKSYLNNNLTSVTTSLQATGKVTALSGVACNRIGRIAILEFDMSMSGGETSNWIDLGSIGVTPSYDVVMNIPPEALSGNAVRVRLYNSNKHLKVFYGSANSFHVRLVFFIDP